MKKNFKFGTKDLTIYPTIVFRRLSSFREDESEFTAKDMTSIDRSHCFVAEMRENPIHELKKIMNHFLEVQFDISGPMLPSNWGNTYVAHFIKARTAKSDMVLL